MFVCTMVQYKYLESNWNDVLNLPGDMHVLIKIYREFYYGIIYIAYEARYVESCYYILLS